MNLKKINALVTGASRGLGLALSTELARAGARVAMVARSPEALHRAAEALAREGATVLAIPGDVGSKGDALRITGAAAAALGEIDLLIHNASELGPAPLRPLLDTDCEDLERALAVNLVGPQRITRAIAGSMSLRGNGFVLFVSSDAAVEAYPRWGAYGASKAAADHLARVWSAELAPSGVRVASIDPGEMDTQMHADAIPDADPAALRAPHEVARAIVRALAEDRVEGGARVTLSSLGTL